MPSLALAPTRASLPGVTTGCLKTSAAPSTPSTATGRAPWQMGVPLT
jgi:hypothetical protein